MVSTLCTSCGLEIPAAAQFCSHCGAPRADAVDPDATATFSAPPLSGPGGAPHAGHYGTRPSAGMRVRHWLFGSLEPATILVFTAAACAFGLPPFVYAYADPQSDGDGARAVLAILLALAFVAAAAGTWAASFLAKQGSEERTASRLVFGVGVFACVLTALQFLTTLGR